MEGRLVITDFDVATGQPRGPHARDFVNHLGYLARDRLPINAHEWKKNKQHPVLTLLTSLLKIEINPISGNKMLVGIN